VSSAAEVARYGIVLLALLAAWPLAAHPAAAAAAPPCAACAEISLTPAQALAAPPDLNGTHLLLRIAPGTASVDWSEALADLRGRKGSVGIHITDAPHDDDPLLSIGGDALLIEVHQGDPDRLAFSLKQAFTRARAIRSTTTLVLAAGRQTLLDLLQRDVGPYVDALLSFDEPVGAAAASGHPEWRRQDGRLQAAAQVIDARDSADATVWTLTADAVNASSVLRDLALLQSWLPRGLVSVPERAVRCGATALPTFLDPQTLDLVANAGSCAPDANVAADVQGAALDRLQVRGATLVRLRGGTGERFAQGIDVAGARKLTVEEVIARHQAAVARQDREVRTAIATGTLTLTFEAPGFPAPVTVTSRTTIYRSDARTDFQQQDIRVNGVSFSGGGIPRLPIIEPERVAAPPLGIALNASYTYRLIGRETIDGHDCYLVKFSPRDRQQPLFDGRAWIDAREFALVRTSAVQTGLRGPVTASEQIDDFRPATPGIWMLARSDVRQTYEGAAVRTPIHRLLILDRYEINPADFTTRREAAYASNDVLLRDTPQGFRYLVRPARSPNASPAHVEPVVAPRIDRVRTIAAGVIVDPNISRPLPFAGLSYVDFDLFGTGAQLNAFFGGSYGQMAFSAPSFRGTRWQIAARAFGIASSYNDRAFVEGRELYEQDIRQRPAQASVWTLRPVSPRVSLRVGYEWSYTHYSGGDVTAPSFIVPANQVVHAALVGMDVQRAGWQGSVWWRPARRAGWRLWGLPASSRYDPSQADFQQYGLSMSRSLAIRPRLAARFEAAWVDGHDLDRFSRYSFGTFDNRLHGYPSALIRYDRGAVFRSAIGWSAARALRIDGFLDTAQVHDPGFGARSRNYTGFGAALEAPAPFRMLAAIEWGYGIRGINPDGSTGTHVVRITAYKVF
jgi:hypothetical protein